jgi:hypothetical protein
MSDDKIHDAVHAVFDPVVGQEKISIIKKRDETIYIGISRPTSPWCTYLELYIYTSVENENNIHVHQLDNCGEKKKGRELLMLVEELAISIGSRQITLLDASKIKMGTSYVSLKILYNLTTGHSWYNSLGYICLDNTYGSYAEVYEHNRRKISNTNIVDFIEENKREVGFRDEKELIDTLFREITEFYPELSREQNIQEYFTIIKKILEQGTSPKIYSIIKLLNYIEQCRVITTSIDNCELTKVMDSSILIKDIQREPTISGGKKQKKRNKTKRKMRRYKKSRKRIKYN